MTDMMPDSVTEPEVFAKDRAINFRDQINEQISICRGFMNKSIDESTIDMAYEAVNSLKSLLIYWVEQDNSYKKALENIETEYMKRMGGMTAMQKEQNETSLKKEFVREKFELLIKLATRRGFTLIKVSKANLKRNYKDPIDLPETITPSSDGIKATPEAITNSYEIGNKRE